MSRPAPGEPRPRAPGLGIALATDIDTTLELARKADRFGLDEVWTTEFVHRSAIVSMAAIAAITEDVGVGSAITYGFGRSPVLLASSARDIYQLSNGRLILGLGSAQPARIRDWLGVDPRAAADRMGELVELLRLLWAQPEVSFDGRFYRVRVEPVGPAAAPPAVDIPVYLAAVNHRMLAIAGKVADGVICHPITSRRLLEEHVLPTLHETAASAGRSVPKVATMPIVVIHDDITVARRVAAAQIAFYAQHETYRFVFEHHGHAREGAMVREAAGRGDWSAMIDAVPAELIDALAAAGPAPLVKDAVADLTRHADHAILHSPSVLASEPLGAGLPSGLYHSNVEAIIEIFGSPNSRGESVERSPASGPHSTTTPAG